LSDIVDLASPSEVIIAPEVREILLDYFYKFRKSNTVISLVYHIWTEPSLYEDWSFMGALYDTFEDSRITGDRPLYMLRITLDFNQPVDINEESRNGFVSRYWDLLVLLFSTSRARSKMFPHFHTLDLVFKLRQEVLCTGTERSDNPFDAEMMVRQLGGVVKQLRRKKEINARVEAGYTSLISLSFTCYLDEKSQEGISL